MASMLRPSTTRAASSMLRQTQFVRRMASASSSRKATAASARPAAASIRFNPPPDSPSAFLAELRSFAAGRPNDVVQSALPSSSFSGSVDLVLSGQRRVVSASSEFDFACSGCGACCKSYPNDVMLDPADVWRVSRGLQREEGGSGGEGGRCTTTELFRRFPKAFAHQMGQFEPDEAAPSPSSVASEHRLAPVLFLATKRVKQVLRGADSKAVVSAATVEERCWFAFKADKNEVDLAEADALPSSATKAKGLRCSLGPANQPTACALYPLGELWKPAAATTTAAGPTAAPAVTQYFTLDTTNCEGARVRSSASTRTTVAAYALRNRLPERRAEWEWFQQLVHGIASREWLSLSDASPLLPPPVREELRAALASAWYDFDGLLDCAPEASTSAAPSSATPLRRFPDWPSAQRAISAATAVIDRETAQLVAALAKNPRNHQALVERWRQALRKEGVSRRDAK